MVALIDGLSKGGNEPLKYKVMVHILAALATGSPVSPVAGLTGGAAASLASSWPDWRRRSQCRQSAPVAKDHGSHSVTH